MDEIIEAAKAAEIHDFINELPEGYNTICGSSASLFSGGQNQRICIARALVGYRNWNYLYGDEITSALDSKTAEKITDTILSFCKSHGKSFICSTHSKYLMSKCELIVYICQDGSVLIDSLSNLMVRSLDFRDLFTNSILDSME